MINIEQMVLTGKTLDEMLEEINWENPITLKEKQIKKGQKPKNNCYFFKDNTVIQEYNPSITYDIEQNLCSFIGMSKDKISKKIDFHPILELINNALDWGKGIKNTEYYSSPNGIVMRIKQNKSWNPYKIIKNFKKGNNVSKRNAYGGHGLMSADNSNLNISYDTHSTNILFKK